MCEMSHLQVQKRPQINTYTINQNRVLQSRTEKVGQVFLRNLAKIELSKPGLL
jgi:hypothetical protein